MDTTAKKNVYAWKTAARELAIQFSFQFFFKPDYPFDQLESEFKSFLLGHEELCGEQKTSDPSPQTQKMALKTIQGIAQNLKHLKEVIQSHLKENWLFSHLVKIDRALLLVGLHEIRETSTPHQVIISEMVKLAQKYGTRESPAFINGVLNAIIKNESS